MKLNTINLVGACVTLPFWVLAIMAAIVFSASDHRIMLSLTGLLIASLWGINGIGSAIGIATIVMDPKSIRSWFGFGVHAVQIFVTLLLFIIGSVTK